MDKSLRHIDILLFDDMNIVEVAGPSQVFASANELGQERYRLRYISIDGKDVLTSCGLTLRPNQIAAVKNSSQGLLVPGGRGIDTVMQDVRFQKLISDWLPSGEGRQVISVCSGSLLLAQCGLLDGRSATTHWNRQSQALTQFPEVNWAIDKLYCVDDDICTSAGVTAGIDLALEIVRRDCGATVALSVARQMVVYLKREGGQTQFSELLDAQLTKDEKLARLVQAMVAQPKNHWTLETMADFIGQTPRTLSRHFAAAFGQSPVKYLERIRVKRATHALDGGAPTGVAVGVSGFADFQQMQRAFKRHLGTTVGVYKTRFDSSS